MNRPPPAVRQGQRGGAGWSVRSAVSVVGSAAAHHGQGAASGGVEAFRLGLEGQGPGEDNGAGGGAAHVLDPVVRCAAAYAVVRCAAAYAVVRCAASAGDRTARDDQGEEERDHVANRCKLHALKIGISMYSKGTHV
jgi:hypothetical protein